MFSTGHASAQDAASPPDSLEFSQLVEKNLKVLYFNWITDSRDEHESITYQVNVNVKKYICNQKFFICIEPIDYTWNRCRPYSWFDLFTETQRFPHDRALGDFSVVRKAAFEQAETSEQNRTMLLLYLTSYAFT